MSLCYLDRRQKKIQPPWKLLNHSLIVGEKYLASIQKHAFCVILYVYETRHI